MVEHHGIFIEVFVDTSVEECARRDTKGLYEKAQKGIIKNFTGVDDPYEVPERPEFIAKTEESTPEEIVEAILTFLNDQKIITV
jgi:adenylylsulfate kinase-like enzyme